MKISWDETWREGKGVAGFEMPDNLADSGTLAAVGRGRNRVNSQKQMGVVPMLNGRKSDRPEDEKPTFLSSAENVQDKLAYSAPRMLGHRA